MQTYFTTIYDPGDGENGPRLEHACAPTPVGHLIDALNCFVAGGRDPETGWSNEDLGHYSLHQAFTYSQGETFEDATGFAPRNRGWYDRRIARHIPLSIDTREEFAEHAVTYWPSWPTRVLLSVFDSINDALTNAVRHWIARKA